MPDLDLAQAGLAEELARARPAEPAAQGFEAGFELDLAEPAAQPQQALAQARAVGYAQGWAQGLREAAERGERELARHRSQRQRLEQEHAARLAAAVTAVEDAAQRLRRAEIELTEQACDTLVRAAVELAELLLGRQLADAQASARAVLSRVLPLVAERQPVTIYLSPAEHAVLTGPQAGSLLAAAGLADADAERVRLECDRALAPGDAVAHCGASTIDARLSTALARLRGALSEPAARP